MKTFIEILDEQSKNRHSSVGGYYDNRDIDVFDGKFSHVQQGANEYAKQYLLEVKKQIDAQCGNEYGTLTHIDGLIAELDKPQG